MENFVCILLTNKYFLNLSNRSYFFKIYINFCNGKENFKLKKKSSTFWSWDMNSIINVLANSNLMSMSWEGYFTPCYVKHQRE